VTDQADQPDTRPISPLRQRMLEDMAMHGLRAATQRDYLRFVRSFAAFLRRPPDTATPEDIRRFQVFQAGSGVQPPTINCSVSALRFFFTVTLDRSDLSRRLVLVRHPRRLPTVLSGKEVGQLLEAAPHAPEQRRRPVPRPDGARPLAETGAGLVQTEERAFLTTGLRRTRAKSTPPCASGSRARS
jgi:integrase